MNELALKVYQVDYEFISKNCLNPELWNKVWNLFVYRNYIFTLEISSINVRDNLIWFDLHLSHGSVKKCRTICFHRNTENYLVLKKQVNGAMFNLIQDLENYEIHHTDEYYEIDNSRASEQYMLREIAEAFLDDEGVSNSDIRDIYIESYIDNHSRIDSSLRNYEIKKQYTILSELYLVYTKAIGDETRHEIVLNKLRNENEEDIEDIISELKEYAEKIENQDQDLIDELTDELESL